MIKNLIAASTTVLFLAFTCPVAAQKNTAKLKSDVKFIDDIEVGIGSPSQEPVEKESKFAIFKNLFSRKHPGTKSAAISSNINNTTKAVNSTDQTNTSNAAITSISNSAIENANNLQFKYSVLLDTEVEEVQNIPLFHAIDEWYGTPYVYGGATKNGIDCSAFVQAIYAGVLGIMLPRTAREQHKMTKPISRTELRQGDLLFFNTRGGVSHVGIYLQNNKFVHAATSGGVMISDIFEDYWVKRFISAGRFEDENAISLFFQTHP